MDGLLINSEDLYTECTNKVLNRYGKPNLPWNIKAQIQGRPAPKAFEILQEWANLPIPNEQFRAETAAMQEKLFPSTVTLPGVEKLLKDLEASGVHAALATSSHAVNFRLKAGHLEHVFNTFPERRRVLGDDSRIPKGKGKPAPDIYLLALQMVNETLPEGEKKIEPEECLVFEDSVPGVESGRRAGMRVIWCPHPELFNEFRDRVPEVLAGKADTYGEAAGQGEVDDGWAEYLSTLENFPYERYGIKVQPVKAHV
jgi:pseudouridine-5'-monophosphatase